MVGRRRSTEWLAALGATFSVLLLVFAGVAGAQLRPHARLANVVATVAGRPVPVSCETSKIAWNHEIADEALASGAAAYYDPNADVIRFGPLVCNSLAKPRRKVTRATVGALFIAAHEAAHASGVENEGVANCWGLYWAQDLARRFHGVRFFSAASRRVRMYAREIQQDAPPEYRDACPV